MSWVEVFAVFVVSHLVGDFLLQTDWQARYKEGGLGPDPVHRRALVSHVLTYMLAFVPALIWIGIETDVAWAVLIAAVIAVPHLVQDDRRLLDAYMARVKGLAETSPGLRIAVDQSFHVALPLRHRPARRRLAPPGGRVGSVQTVIGWVAPADLELADQLDVAGPPASAPAGSSRR